MTNDPSPPSDMKLLMVLLLIATVMGLVIWYTPPKAHGQETALMPLECGIERETPNEAFMYSQYLENGLEAFMYDTNGDKQFDVQIMLPQGDQNRYPLMYMFDRDYDGDPDITYGDTLRDGTCDGIEVLWTGDRHNDKQKEL